MKTILVDAVDALVTPEKGMFQEMFELLETYEQAKIVLTNADDEQMKKFGLDSLPYDVFTMKHAPNKSDPVYYETMLETFSLTADDVLYFEHSLEAVCSAQSIGIVSYHYDATTKDLAALQAFIDAYIE